MFLDVVGPGLGIMAYQISISPLMSLLHLLLLFPAVREQSSSKVWIALGTWEELMLFTVIVREEWGATVTNFF